MIKDVSLRMKRCPSQVNDKKQLPEKSAEYEGLMKTDKMKIMSKTSLMFLLALSTLVTSRHIFG